jgi:hypothetical protein
MRRYANQIDVPGELIDGHHLAFASNAVETLVVGLVGGNVQREVGITEFRLHGPSSNHSGTCRKVLGPPRYKE